MVKIYLSLGLRDFLTWLQRNAAPLFCVVFIFRGLYLLIWCHYLSLGNIGGITDLLAQTIWFLFPLGFLYIFLAVVISFAIGILPSQEGLLQRKHIAYLRELTEESQMYTNAVETTLRQALEKALGIGESCVLSLLEESGDQSHRNGVEDSAQMLRNLVALSKLSPEEKEEIYARRAEGTTESGDL